MRRLHARLQALDGDVARRRSPRRVTLAKGLPEGSASKAVAGYLYFPASIREKKRSPLELTYKLKDQTIVFSLQ